MFGNNAFGSTEYASSGSSGTLFTVALTETLTLVAALRSFVISKVIVQAIVLVDNVFVTLARRFSAALSLDDNMMTAYGRTLRETVTITATLATRISGIVLRETMTLVATVSKRTATSLSASLTLVDTFTKIAAKHCGETITLVFSIVSYMNGFRVGLWERTARVVTEWTKGARVNDADQWTKSARNNDQDEWTPTDKQF